MINTSQKTSLLTKKVTALVFLLFLFLHTSYAPWSGGSHSNSFLHQLFSLYFFITNQTLGIVHEGGHGVCYILHCPQFITALNGTIFQLLFPLLFAYYYARKGQRFLALVGLFFVGFSLQYTAWYISTAHEGLHVSASKSFLGVDGYHDFNYILSSLHLLAYDALISGIVKVLATLIMIVSTFWMLIEGFASSE